MDKSWLRFFAQKVKIDGESIRVGYDTVEGMVFTQEYGIPKNPNYIILGYIRPNGGCILDQLRKLYFAYYVDKVGKNYEEKLKRDVQKMFIPEY